VGKWFRMWKNGLGYRKMVKDVENGLGYGKMV